jgi:hypothetical protein
VAAIDSTPSGENANSYISVSDADDYFSNHLYPSDWDDSTIEIKESALIMCTRILDEKIDWIGNKNTSKQALAWGRSGVIDDGYDVDSTIVPEPVKNATAEFAKHLIADNSTENADGKGLEKLEVGSVKLTFDKADTADVLPNIVQEMLREWGNIWTRNKLTTIPLTRN